MVVSSTMGFTPAGGLVMGTRPGDVDPGTLVYLTERGMTAAELQRLINREAGLLAPSELSSDMQQLFGTEISVPSWPSRSSATRRGSSSAPWRRSWTGSTRWSFTRGIGTGSAAIRARICAGLGHLGVHLDPGGNAAHRDVVSAEDSAVTVRVIATDEELMIARHTQALVLAGARPSTEEER